MKRTIVIPIFLFFGFVANAQQLTLAECYTLAEENYPLIQRYDLIAQTEKYTIQNLNKAWYPQIDINAQATYQNEVTSLDISLPSITIDPLSKEQYKVYADVSQSIYDGGITSQQKKLTEKQAEVNRQANQVQMDLLKQRINQLYFGILQTQAQILQLKLTQSDVENGLQKATAQLEYGTIFRSAVDVLKAQLLQLEQQKITLEATQQKLTDVLSVFLGKTLSDTTEWATPPSLILSDTDNRAELRLFRLQKEQIELQKKLIRAKNLPKLGAFFQGGYGKPGYNMLKNEADIFYMVGARLNIPISGFYTQKKSVDLLSTQQQEIDVQQDLFLFHQKMELLQSDEELDKMKKLIAKDDEVISLRENILKSALAQLDNGVITTNDYLKEVNELSKAKNEKITYEINYLRTQYDRKAQLNN